jgi:hypothetical protein
MPPEETPHDPLPALLAEIDQTLKMAGELARVVRTYYDAFLEEGFNDRQALYAAITWIKGPSEPPSE